MVKSASKYIRTLARSAATTGPLDRKKEKKEPKQDGAVGRICLSRRLASSTSRKLFRRCRRRRDNPSSKC